MTNKPMLSVERDSIALEALKVARQFIANGIELGHIRMPEPETPDPAHDTLPMIDRAIVELRALLNKPDGKNWEYFHNAMESERDYWKALAQKQAAQHQGDTNPITGDMYRLMEAYRIGEFSAESGSETVEALSVAAFDSVESQGHDADSYMAGYCAALYEQGKPFIGLALKPKHQVEPVKWERMSIMEGGKWWPCDDKEEADAAVLCGWKVRALYAEQPAPVAEVMPFAEKVISKLQRFEACVSDGQDVDIDRHWFDVLTHLGLLRRVQRSPAYWEITQQGEDALKTTHCNSPQ
ncbi:hypothetical protein SAMN04490192_1926 [Pseudomonas lundensis]|uniref:hypothetical protein n=1 Tax=Pseudomonas lundensis TaxID=86185 RepID=UPI000889FF87|nr:hypothetical protein [Pseudomonas lundensis]SDQ57090.1 hypothetical protein SAMN04490192_1926 [Pseudomonas lundensis]